MKMLTVLRSAMVFISTMCLSLPALTQNLVPNSSFETVTAEPYYGCELNYATGWLNPSGGGCPSNNYGTPDLFSTLSSGQAVLPNSFMGTTNAHTGQRCAGFVTYHAQLADYREYLMANLSCPLIPGVTYNASFWTTGGNPVEYIYHSNNLEIYLSTTPLTQNGYNLITGITPQYTISNIIANSNWTQYSFTFTATQPYQYMTIGNFKSDANTTVQSFGSNRPYAYYFFDDISLTPEITPLFLGNDTTYCGNFNRVLQTGNPNTIWSTGVTAAQLSINAPGTYWATVTNGCTTFSDTIVIAQSSSFAINLGADTSICQGNSVNLNANTPGASYQWSVGSTAPSISVVASGVYWVDVTQAGCTVRDSIAVQVDGIPIPFNLGADSSVCGNFTIQLNSNNNGAVWNTGFSGASISVSNPGSYWASVSNACGSIGDTIIIDQEQKPNLVLSPDTSLCANDSTTLNAFSSAANLVWNTGATTSTIIGYPGNQYWAVAWNNPSCKASDTINTNLTVSPGFDLGKDTTVCGQNGLALNIPIAYSTFLWNDNSTDSFRVITVSGTYAVTVTNGCGTSSDMVTLNVLSDDCMLYIPTAFSPNSDGANDKLRGISHCGVKDYQLHIYNRWGEEVFETTDIKEGWDGFYKGVAQPMGVYVWWAEYFNYCANKKLQSKGNFTLLR